MIVFKATNHDMTCHMGQGIFQYKLGVPAVAENSKCGGTGLHACEYVLDCTSYYNLSGRNRFFLAEAEGDIAEDGVNTRIACTKLTLVKELTHREIAGQALLFMVGHPCRDGWEAKRAMLEVKRNSASVNVCDGIAIARGENPMVKGVIGSHLGLIRENDDGTIAEAKLFTIGEKYKPDTWYTIENREPKEVRDET